MNNRLVLMILGLAGVSAVAPLAAQQQAIDPYREATKALERGDLLTAEEMTNRVLKVSPNHIPAKDLLTRIQMAKVAAVRGATKTKLAAVTIDRIQFDGTPFKDAVATLRTKLRQRQADTNLLIMDPAGKIRDTEVAGIDVSNVPATAAINFIAEAVGARVEYRADSVVFSPK